MRKLIGLLIAVLGWTGGASAALITETWTATVDEVNAASLNALGDTIHITATWDDAGTSFNRWNDKSNGIAEFGLGDDTVNDIFMLGTSHSGYQMLSNASISFTGINLSANPADIFNTNQTRVTETIGNLLRVYYAADNLFISLDDSFEQVPQSGFSLVDSRVSIHHAYLVGSELRQSVFSAALNPVPIPATLTLFSIGLACLGWSRRKKS